MAVRSSSRLLARARRVLVVWLALAVAALSYAVPARAATAAAPRPATAGTGSIGGTVTDAVTGAALPGVTVTVSQPEQADPAPTHTVTTGADGSYRVDGLVDTGSYAVSFRYAGSTYLPEAWPHHHSWEGWEPIYVAAGQDVTGIDAALEKGVRVTGRITTADATPVPVSSGAAVTGIDISVRGKVKP